MDEQNNYDRKDRVKREAALIGNGLKVAAYRVRDPDTDEWSTLQFHMTYNNTVIGLMEEEAAKVFARFVGDTIARTVTQKVVDQRLARTTG